MHLAASIESHSDSKSVAWDADLAFTKLGRKKLQIGGRKAKGKSWQAYLPGDLSSNINTVCMAAAECTTLLKFHDYGDLLLVELQSLCGAD